MTPGEACARIAELERTLTAAKAWRDRYEGAEREARELCAELRNERDTARADAVRAAMYSSGLPADLALRIDSYRLELEANDDES